MVMCPFCRALLPLSKLNWLQSYYKAGFRFRLCCAIIFPAAVSLTWYAVD